MLKTYIKKAVYNIKTCYILITILSCLIAIATFLEKSSGAIMAQVTIYHNPAVFVLWGLLVVNTICIAIKNRWLNRGKWGVITLHASFVVILLGALITHIWGYEATLHLRQGESKNIVKTAGKTITLPFTIKLLEFKIERYNGSLAPSSFASIVEIDGVQELIGVNKMLSRDGFRIYQTSYDKDERGTILTLNHDVAGMRVTYLGYFLILLGILLIIASKESHLRSLLQKLKTIESKLILLYILALSPQLSSAIDNRAIQTIPLQHTKSVEKLWIQDNGGRIVPMDSYARKLLRKIHRKSSYKSLSAVQVVWGTIFNPEYWSAQPIISQKNDEIAAKFNLPANYISYYDIFEDNGNYKLSSEVKKASATAPSQRGSYEKDLLKLDERISIIYSLQKGDNLQIFPLPDDKNRRWFSIGDNMEQFSGRDSLFVSKIMNWYTQSIYQSSSTGDWSEPEEIVSMIKLYQTKKSRSPLPSESRMNCEILYNSINPIFYTMIGYFVIALALFVFSFNNAQKIKRVLSSTLILCFILHTATIIARWYISQQPPWASAYESMLHSSWAAALTSILLLRRSALPASLAALFASVVLFVASLNWLDPEITPLVPVLQSPWLMIHVATITASYALMGIAALIGVTAMWLYAFNGEKSKIFEMKLISEITLNFALYLITIGIFIGAIWANESWGRYWGWDPKESWALITMFCYVMVLHLRYIPKFNSDFYFFFFSTIAFASVLMTYFGVNFYLTGLHSYAVGELPSTIYIIYIFYALFVISSIFIKLKLNKDHE